MAEHGGGGGGASPAGFALMFFGAIAAIWYFGSAQGGGGIFGNATSSIIRFNPITASSTAPSSTPESTSHTNTSWGSYWQNRNRDEQISAATTRDIEREISNASREVRRIEESAEEAKKWGVLSSYKDKVRLSKGGAGSEDSTKEYLTVTYAGSNTDTLTLSGWTLESTVSGKRVTIPQGTRLPRAGSMSTQGPIALEPRESALILTGESPIGTSFHENKCTGYLNEHQEFYPALHNQCPRPRDEFDRFASIPLSDDSCHEYIPRIPSCERVDAGDIKNLSSACRTFIQDTFSYGACVKNHHTDPYFYEGKWRVYLERTSELWRQEREIIRLLDSEGKTVDLLEY